MKSKLYIETSIVSYLAARPSRNIITAARQALTRQWWEQERSHYDLFISEFVFAESSEGDHEAAQQRLKILDDLPTVDLPDDVRILVSALIDPGPIPEKAALDAFHIAAAVAGGADYLLTWNFKHLANAILRKRIDAICRSEGYEPPVICTPEELLSS